MTARALSIGLGVVLWATGAQADKPKIAVLGLEVGPGPGGAIDPGAQLIAREVTKELRQRALSPACPYLTAPNSNKDLLHEKLLMSCESEALDCMVVIAAGLASDALLYGRVDKRGEGFRISLKLLDAKRRSTQFAVEDLPAPGGVTGASRRLYRRLIGDGPGDGALLVKARSVAGAPVRGGAVVVDDEPRGQLVDGKLLITGVGEGRHSVAIDAGGFHRYEEIVTLHTGEHATVDAVLHAQPGMPGTPAAAPGGPEPALLPPPAPVADGPPVGPSPWWKVSLVTGAAMVVAGGVFAYYSYDQQNAHLVHITGVDSDRCGDSDDDLRMHNAMLDLEEFRAACAWTTRTYYGYAIAGVGAAAAIASLIILSREPARPDVAANEKRSQLAIAPIVAPGVAGARLAISW